MNPQISNCARYVSYISSQICPVRIFPHPIVSFFFFFMDLIGVTLVLLIGSAVLFRLIDLDPLIVISFVLITT